MRARYFLLLFSVSIPFVLLISCLFSASAVCVFSGFMIFLDFLFEQAFVTVWDMG